INFIYSAVYNRESVAFILYSFVDPLYFIVGCWNVLCTSPYQNISPFEGSLVFVPRPIIAIFSWLNQDRSRRKVNECKPPYLILILSYFDFVIKFQIPYFQRDIQIRIDFFLQSGLIYRESGRQTNRNVFALDRIVRSVIL